jgi:hypothetical protein
MSMLGTEVFVTTCMIVLVGRDGVDRRTAIMAAKCLAACAIVALADATMTPLGLVRYVIDLALYATVVTMTGALRPREISDLVALAIRSRRASAPPA